MAGEIEVDTFNLCVKQIGHGIARLRDWQNKNKTCETVISRKMRQKISSFQKELKGECLTGGRCPPSCFRWSEDSAAVVAMWVLLTFRSFVKKSVLFKLRRPGLKKVTPTT